MAYKVQVTRTAQLDASSYAAYIRFKHKSPVAAKRWLDGLYVSLKRLESLPDRFSVIPEAEELGFEYRSFVYHSHRVVFAVDSNKGLVTVHRVYHGAREDLSAHDFES